VRPGDLVGLFIDRSAEMIAGLLAILKAGGAYVPIDPAYPRQRIQFLLDDSGVSVVVTVSRLMDTLGSWPGQRLCIDGLPDAVVNDALPSHTDARARTDEDVAYVIYTSGSTGTPKGVAVEHRSVLQLFERTNPRFGFDHRDVWTVFHSLSFDFSVWEIWGALLYGGRLVIVPAALVGSPDLFCGLLAKEGVTVLNQTPSAFRPLAHAIARQPEVPTLQLRYIIFGGEALASDPIRLWFAKFGDERPALINMYGITETTVHASYKRLRIADAATHAVSIGEPIPGATFYLLDAAGTPVADGTPGEIYVSGPGVARGYVNRPALTAERFITLPAIAGDGRLYRSGDLAMKTSSGEYVYLGRADDQVKLRGFRIEPAEIEACLLQHPGLSAAVVLPQDYGDGDVRLHAYCVTESSVTSDEDFEDLAAELSALANTLPKHMVPFAYFKVPSIPLTPHGKVDRSALNNVASSLSADDAGTGGSIEAAVVSIWEDILKRRVQPQDDLFVLGGSSLTLLRILCRVNQRFNIVLGECKVGGEATPARMAERILAYGHQQL